MITLPSLDAGRYLKRIRFEGAVRQDFETLKALQRFHLISVPFENLDVWRGRHLGLSPLDAISKIVERARGGWCFEVNTAFAALLNELGFRVTPLAATVLIGERSPTPDHMTLRVDLDRPYLVDVGFGDSFFRPLPLDAPGPHDGGSGEFGVEQVGETLTLYQQGGDSRVDQYRFELAPARLSDFEESCLRLQTDPDSQWHQKPFATRLTGHGSDRVTLLSDRVRWRRAGEWTEEPVEDWAASLQEWFGLSLEELPSRSDEVEPAPGSLRSQ